MTDKKITVGILAPVHPDRDALVHHVEATRLANVKVMVDDYCVSEQDPAILKLLEVKPDVIIVDMHNGREALKSLSTLHATMPDTWLYASGLSSDPQLIIETIHGGAREYLSKPVSQRNISTAFGRYLEEKQRLCAHESTRGKIYSVTAAKGGAGATSIAVNLAVTSAEAASARIALLDLNSSLGDAASYLNLKDPRFTIEDALAAAPRLDPMLLETFMIKAGKVSVLPGPRAFKRSSSASFGGLVRLLKVASGSYTHTFIDLPSAPDEELIQMATEVSDAVLVVMTPELPAVWRIHRLLSFLACSKSADRLRVILNRVDSKDNIDVGKIVKALNHPIYWRLPNNYRAAIQGINTGMAVTEGSKSNLASSYRKLAHDLTGLALPKRREGLTSLLFKKKGVPAQLSGVTLEQPAQG